MGISGAPEWRHLEVEKKFKHCPFKTIILHQSECLLSKADVNSGQFSRCLFVFLCEKIQPSINQSTYYFSLGPKLWLKGGVAGVYSSSYHLSGGNTQPRLGDPAAARCSVSSQSRGKRRQMSQVFGSLSRTKETIIGR